LIVEESFQAALRDLGLIRGVRGVPPRVLNNGSAENRRGDGSVVAEANKRAKREICGHNFP
jgi:hypothetical protein